MSDKFSNDVNNIIVTCIAFLIATSLCYIFPGHILSSNSLSNPITESKNSTIPEFYRSLTEEKGEFSIIEYPAIIQDRYNLIPYYQSFHKKKVLRGYFFSHALKNQWKIQDILSTKIWPFEILSSHLEIKKIYFTFIIDLYKDIMDLYDINSIRNSKAKYIILHKNLKDEIIAIKNNSQINKDILSETNSQNILEHAYRFSLHFKSYYQRYFGEPVYEDSLLIVFRIK